MKSRNTKQKEVIYQVLTECKTHPTIHELYDMVKNKNATIGQATVYRNINKLYLDGMVRKIQYEEVNHYDGDLSEHYHFYCVKCQQLLDISPEEIEYFKKNIASKNNVEVDFVDIIIKGKCSKCKNK